MMVYKEYEYSELSMGGVKMRGNVLSATELNTQLSQNGKVGCYRNHFRFTKDFYDYVKRTGSVSKYTGPCYTDFFWLDIDDSDDLSVALDTAKIYINRLAFEYEIPPDHLRCFFSGKKGFHIGIPAEVFGFEPSPELPRICKALAVSLAGDLDYDESIYDKTRLFRLNNTKHEGSGYYKVELDPKEILQCDDVQTIVDMAATPRQLNREYYPEDSYGVLKHLLTVQEPEPDTPKDDRKPRQNWLTGLIENGAKEGSRTHSIMKLAGYYHSKGIPEDVARALIESWDVDKNNPPLTGDPKYPADKIRTSVASAYQYPGAEEESALILPESVEFQNWISIHEKAPAYIKEFSKNRLTFGFPQIDADSSRLGRGEMAIMLAYVGVGKTVTAQNIQINVMDNHRAPSVLFSMEMSAMRLYFRQVGMVWGMSADEVERDFEYGKGEGLKRNMTPYEHIYIVDHVPLSVPFMAEVIKNSPVDMGLVIVDYVGLMDDTGKDNYQRMNNLSRGLALMAKELNVAVLAIYQTNRTGADGEIHLGMGRDSGMIEANCDIALGLWPDEKDRRQRYIKLLKARHGLSGAKELLRFEGDSPRLWPEENNERSE